MRMHKLGFVALVALFPALISAVWAEEEPRKLEIYLLIGQSNMAGRAPVTEAESGVIEGCYLLNGEDKFEKAKNPLNRFSTIRKGLGMQRLNPGYSFAKEMVKNSEGRSIGLVVNAKGGTRIEQWEQGTEFYKEAVRRAKIAQQHGTLKGVLWHQGESNSKKPGPYLEKLKGLVENLRADLDVQDLPFVAGQIRVGEAINVEIARLPEAVPFAGVATSEGLVTLDGAHFDTKSMLTLGVRYAKAMSEVQGRAK